jgi:ribose transport system ATP-binding protein
MSSLRKILYNPSMANADTLLELRGVSKTFPGVRALDSIDMEIRRGETHILLGENGAGKSTMIKILTGVFPPDAGSILYKGVPVSFNNPSDSQKAGISVVYQEPTLIQHLSVAENIHLGSEPHLHNGVPILDRARMLAETQTLLDRLNLPVDPLARMEELTTAEQRMIEVARALHLSAEMIILDEPTASMSAQETSILFGILRLLRAQGVTVLYISHRLEEVLQIGDRATILRDGRKITTVSLEKTTLDDLIMWIVGQHLPEKFPQLPPTPGPEILRVEDLHRSGVLHHISFRLNTGEILGITGLKESGSTELARALFGLEPAESGTVYLDGRSVTIRSPEDAIANGIGLLPKERLEQGLILEMRAQHNMTLAALESAWPGPLIDHSRENVIVNYFAKKMGIRDDKLNQPALSLSGGTQQKVILSKWLAAHARLLIFEEPTRGIDVGARVEIYHLIGDLARRGTGIILVSVDLTEIFGMCDQIIVMRAGSIVANLPRDKTTKSEILKYSGGGEIP